MKGIIMFKVSGWEMLLDISLFGIEIT